MTQLRKSSSAASLNFSSWNRVTGFLRQVRALREAARRTGRSIDYRLTRTLDSRNLDEALRSYSVRYQEITGPVIIVVGDHDRPGRESIPLAKQPLKSAAER